MIDRHPAITEVECPECLGQGAVQVEHMVAACCGKALPTGECCGNAVPGMDFDWEACPVCEGEGTLPAIHELPPEQHEEKE